MDKNWKWSTKVEDRLNLPFPESVIEMHWGYLGYLEEPQDYFKVIYDQTEQVFVVKDDQGEDMQSKRSERSWKDSEKTVTSDSRWREFWNWQRTTFEKILRTV